jgi:hypothetical protein
MAGGKSSGLVEAMQPITGEHGPDAVECSSRRQSHLALWTSFAAAMTFMNLEAAALSGVGGL